MFFHRGAFIIEMFLNAVVNEACGAINVLLIAAVTRELVHCISSLTQPSVRDRAFVSSAFALRGGEGQGSSESVGFVGNAYRDVFFSKNVSDPVIESCRNVRDLKGMTILCWQVEGFVGGFVGVLSALYCSLDNR